MVQHRHLDAIGGAERLPTAYGSSIRDALLGVGINTEHAEGQRENLAFLFTIIREVVDLPSATVGLDLEDGPGTLVSAECVFTQHCFFSGCAFRFEPHEFSVCWEVPVGIVVHRAWENPLQTSIDHAVKAELVRQREDGFDEVLVEDKHCFHILADLAAGGSAPRPVDHEVAGDAVQAGTLECVGVDAPREVPPILLHGLVVQLPRQIVKNLVQMEVESLHRRVKCSLIPIAREARLDGLQRSIQAVRNRCLTQGLPKEVRPRFLVLGEAKVGCTRGWRHHAWRYRSYQWH